MGATIFEARFSPTISERLHRRLVRTVTGCLEWTGATDGGGYGRIAAGRKQDGNIGTHRLAWELEHGPIPEGLWVLHRCDNPPCCEVEHLFLGTPAENSHDMMDKRRGRGQFGPGHVNIKAKLTREQALAIRSMRNVPIVELARLYGVSATSISKIRSGQRWRG